MRRPVLAVTVAAALLSAGCLGSVEPATIPQDSLDRYGWNAKDETSDSLVAGLGSLEIRDYGPPGNDFSGATVASVNDLPIINEREQVLPRAIERVEDQRDVRFTNPSDLTVDLDNLGQEAPATEYDVEDAGGPAKALIVTPDCGPFVIAAGFGTTVGSQYDNARDVVTDVVC